MIRRHHHNQPQPPAARRATTMAEVLISIMILSIGIVSLATLFPISILRSLQATQLTNATILRYNAETAIEVDTDLVYDPDASGNVLEHDGTNFLVDPLGWAWADGANVGGLRRFKGYSWLTDFTDTAEEAAAMKAVSLPDSWVEVYKGFTASMPTDRKSVTLDAGDVSDGMVDAAQLNGMLTSGIELRATIFSPGGQGSQIRPINGVTGAVVDWIDPLPLGYTDGTQIRIESREPRYTWMLTVRRADGTNGGVANVDVVVFFRRPDPAAGEASYAARFTANDQSATVSYTGQSPDLEKGGFILDADNAIWYQIQNVTDNETGTARLQLDRPANKGGDTAVVMRGVVEVYPIGTKQP